MAVITISREAGCGGESIAELASHKLGFKFFNKELIKYIAVLSDKTEEEVKKFDEEINKNIRSAVKRLFDNGLFSNPFKDIKSECEENGEENEECEGKESLSYFDTYSEVEPVFNSRRFMKMSEIIIKNLATTSNCMIVGRGSQFILENEPNTLHLRLAAPLEYRVARFMQKENISEAKAAENIKAMEKKRNEYVKHFYKKDISDFSSYHAVINVSKYTEAEAAELIVAMAKNSLKF